MSENPNPLRITDEMWRLWEGCYRVIPGLRFGGIFADKVCYHNTVNANKLKWPSAYCIQLSLDLKGPLTKARAIDLTMSTYEMMKRTKYLRDSALDPEDDRLFGLREFYGTLDGTTVYGLSKTDEDGPWTRVSSDTSHLWHIHASFFTFYCDNEKAMAGFLSVISGQTYEEWKAIVAIPSEPASIPIATYTNAYNASSILRGLAGKNVQSDGTVKQRDEKGNFINDVKPADILNLIADRVIEKLHADGWIVKPSEVVGGVTEEEATAIAVGVVNSATVSVPTPPA